jgi:hypothetical protein
MPKIYYKQRGLNIDRTEYLKNWKLHRVDGPAIVWNNGMVAYYINGKLHRDDGPAFISENQKGWYINGMAHRLDGPAVISILVDIIYEEEYWINGVEYNKPEYLLMTRNIKIKSILNG